MTEPELKYPEWQSALLDAIREMDSRSMHRKIAELEPVLQHRLEQLRQNAAGQQTREEEQALLDALSTLRVFRERE